MHRICTKRGGGLIIDFDSTILYGIQNSSLLPVGSVDIDPREKKSTGAHFACSAEEKVAVCSVYYPLISGGVSEVVTHEGIR